MQENDIQPARNPTASIIIGVICVVLIGLLTVRIVWEETALTLQQGPQMIGFSLAHGYYAPLLLAPLVTVIWLLIAVIVVVRRHLKSQPASPTLISLIGLAVLSLVVLSLPDAFWQRAFISKFAKSPHAADLMTMAAAEGNTSTVKAYLDHGVPLEATNYEGSTAAYTAAAGGSVEVLRILTSRGANLNATNLYGDSPLEVAVGNKHKDAADYLRSQHAKQIRGTEEQHQAASEMIVRRDIESMHH
jgi:hypothetical protein